MGKSKNRMISQSKQFKVPSVPSNAQEVLQRQMLELNRDPTLKGRLSKPRVPSDNRRDAKVFWPSNRGSMPHSTWVNVWPNYLDKNKTVKMGRRIKLDLAVETPTVDDLREACRGEGLRHVVFPFKVRICCRVALFQNGAPFFLFYFILFFFFIV